MNEDLDFGYHHRLNSYNIWDDLSFSRQIHDRTGIFFHVCKLRLDYLWDGNFDFWNPCYNFWIFGQKCPNKKNDQVIEKLSEAH